MKSHINHKSSVTEPQSRKLTLDRRGVSNVLGFLLILGIVLSVIFITFAFGLDTIGGLFGITSEEENESGLEVIQSELDQAVTDGESKTFAATFVDASVRIGGQPVQLHIEADESPLDETFESYPVIVDVPDRDLEFRYVFGHIYRVDGPGSPDTSAQSRSVEGLSLSGSSAHLSLAMLSESGTLRGVDDPSEISFQADLIDNSDFTRVFGESDTLTLTIEGDQHPESWERAFESAGAEDVDIDGYEVSATTSPERLTVFWGEIEFLD